MVPQALVSETLLLAAIDRAERHRGHQGVPSWAIYEHLAAPQRSAAARQARRLLDPLTEAGSLKAERRQGIQVWALTTAGRKYLDEAEDVAPLPESPQHATWREAYALAIEQIEGFQETLRETLEEALALTTDTAPADTWFYLAERLHTGARRLGSATYCIREWAEPTNNRRDFDDHTDPSDAAFLPPERKRREARRAGRRNLYSWGDTD